MEEIYSSQIPLKKNICHKKDILAELQKATLHTVVGLSEKDKADIKIFFNQLNGDLISHSYSQAGGFQYKLIVDFPGKGIHGCDDFDIDDIVAFSVYDLPHLKSDGITFAEEFNYFDLKRAMLYTKIYLNKRVSQNYEIESISDMEGNYDIQPEIAKWFLKHRLCGETAGFKISNWPIRLRYEDGFNVKNIIERNTTLDIPVVISRISQSTYDTSRLYKVAPGALLILTEDDPGMFEWLEENIDDYKEKLGKTIPDENELAVYFPKIKKPLIYNFQSVIFNDEVDEDGEEIEEEEIEEDEDNKELNRAVFEKTILFDFEKYMLSNLNYDATYTHYRELVVIKQDAIIHDYKNKIEDLQTRNEFLKASLSNAKKLAKNAPTMTYKTQASDTEDEKENNAGSKIKALTLKSTEADLYPQELREIVMDSLAEYRSKYVQDGSRRATVLDSVLQNTTYDRKVKAKEKEIVETMKTENTTSPLFVSAMEKLGFKVKSKSNHLKMQYMGDPRYTIVLSKTPSDMNANKNATREIINKCL